MNNPKTHFIRTSDEDTAKQLRSLGLSEMAKEGSFFVFINDWSKQNFSSVDEKKLSFTNKICI